MAANSGRAHFQALGPAGLLRSAVVPMGLYGRACRSYHTRRTLMSAAGGTLARLPKACFCTGCKWSRRYSSGGVFVLAARGMTLSAMVRSRWKERR